MSPRSTGRELVVLALVLVAVISAPFLIPAPRAQTSNPSIGYNRCFTVTPSDTVDLAPFSQNQALTGVIYVGGAGNLVVAFSDGTLVNFTAAVAGFTIPIAVRRVNSTSTTATAIVACYRQ